jgi:hypothetical protein
VIPGLPMGRCCLSHYFNMRNFNMRGGHRHHYFRAGLPSVGLIKWGRASDEEVGDVWAYPAGEEWECLYRGTR